MSRFLSLRPATGFLLSKCFRAQVRWPYLELFRILQQTSGVDAGITYEDFLNGYTIFAFQLSESLPSTQYVTEKKRGDTVVCFDFHEKPDKPSIMFVVGVFQEQIFLSASSGLLKTYTV